MEAAVVVAIMLLNHYNVANILMENKLGRNNLRGDI
jgi:hypothetical protein